MSADSQIFVSGAAMETLVEEIAALLPDARFRPEVEGRGTSFANAKVLGEVRTHEYDPEGDLNFPDYPLVVEFQGIRNAPDSAATQREFGQLLFDTLSLRTLDLLWVFNLQHRLGEHHPRSSDVAL